jgi:hypothetical protein
MIRWFQGSTEVCKSNQKDMKNSIVKKIKESTLKKIKETTRVKITELKEKMEEKAGGWNGKDDQFNVGGTTYSEEDAHHSNEVIEACEHLEALLDKENQS